MGGGSGKIIGTFQSISSKADSVLNTKGDLATYSTERIRLGIGSNNQTLLADSAQATGNKWAASSTSTLTTAGDLLYASGANTLARLARGSDNQVLKMNGTALNWETLPSASNDYYHISTTNVTSPADSVTLSSLGLDMTALACVKLIISGNNDTSGANFYCQLNGATSGSKYNYNMLTQDNTTLAGSESINQNDFKLLTSGILDSASVTFFGEITIANNYYLTASEYFDLWSNIHTSTAGQEWFSGAYADGSTNTLGTIKLGVDDGNFDKFTVSLFGVVNS